MEKVNRWVIIAGVLLAFHASAGEDVEFCPPEAMFGSHPAPTDSGTGFPSDEFRNFRRFEYFDGMERDIAKVGWFGAGVATSDDSECTRVPESYLIRFYTLNVDEPGSETYSEIVTATRTATSLTLVGRPVYRFEAELSTPLTQPLGFISIAGADDAACSFVWYSSLLGDGIHFRESVGTGTISPINSADLAFCLIPVPAEGEGEGGGEGWMEGDGEPSPDGEGITGGDGEGVPDGEGGGEGASIICDNQEVASGSFAGCQTNTLSSQRPAPELDPDSGFYGSDLAFSSGAGDYRADEFEGATGAIQSVRWWGTTLQFGFPCTRDAGEFLIRFYSDTPNGTNSPDFEQSVSPVITSTNATANSFPVFQYEANLNTPVNMESGWLSIVASGDDDCFFYWYRSDEGNKTHTRIQGTSASFGGGDFGYCLMACPLPAPEGEPDGEGMTEGVVDGEGGSEGQPEGSVEGSPEGGTEGDPEGTVEGSTEGTTEGTMDGEAELQYPPIDQCASDSIGGQRPYGLDPVLSGFYFSDVINNDFRIETFSGINQPIGGVRWWGTSITPSFINCDRTSARFRVSFFESGTLPGEVLDSFDVTAVRTNTGAVYAGRPVYRLEAVFPRTVNVSSGWVAIAGIEDFGCLAYWYRSDQGDTDHVRVSNGEFSGASGDMSYCFLPEGFVLEGEGTTEGSTEGSIEGAPEGTVEGGGEAEGEGASSPPDNCPDFSMASQRPAPLDSLESGVYGSDVFRNDDQRIEYFYGASEPIAVVRWWGVGLDMQFGASCERSNNAFIIRFYQGDPFTRGDLVSEQTVLATQEDTGEIVSNRVLYRHRAELDTPVTLFSGWIGIQGTGDSECSFYWYRSDEGSGDHIRVVSSPTTPGAGGDLSYCLLPSFDDPLPGHSADQNGDDEIILSELLRVVQLFNAGVFQCGTGTEDGYALGDADRECPPHAGDYNPRDWQFSLSELLRMIQFYSSGGFYECEPSEDGFCAGVQL